MEKPPKPHSLELEPGHTIEYRQELGPQVKEFFYTKKNETGDEEVAFRCSAHNIEEADLKFKDEIGYDPKVDPSIGCVIDAPVNKDWIAKQR